MAVIDFESRKRELEKKRDVEVVAEVKKVEALDDDDTWFKNETIDWSLKSLEMDYNYVFELHMEIVGSNLESDELDSYQKALLRKYAKVKNSISRTVLVSNVTALWQLHYIIQQAFGWSNCHLFNFALLEDEFKAVTNDSVKTWGELCGILFRFPDGVKEDLYWHTSDFNHKQSLKDWYRSKYNFENEYMGLGDYYIQNKECVEEFYKEVPELKPQQGSPVKTRFANIEQLRKGVNFATDVNSLLGRLYIGEVFTLPKYKPDYEDWREEMFELAEFDESEASDLFEDIDARIRNANEFVDKYCDEYGNFKKGVTAKIEKEVDQKIFEARCAADERALLSSAFDPDVDPVTDTVLYNYDFGAGWQVRITCKNIYRVKFEAHDKPPIVLNDEDVEAAPELSENVKAVGRKNKPICIACDGVNVFDVDGGVEGFCDFFEMLYSKDKECVEAAKGLADCYGWTGRMRLPKNIL